MPNQFNTRTWKVGLTVIGGIILFYLGIMWAQRSSIFEPEENTYTVLFDNVNGLLIGDPVTVRGFVSGRVLDIIPNIEAVSVLISMDQRIELRSDAAAEIQIKELMGGKQVAIHPGLSPDKLEPGSALPGVASLDFSSSFSEFGAVIEQVDVDQINHLLARLDTFAGALNELANAMPSDKIESMVNRFNRMSVKLEEGIGVIEEADWIHKADNMFLKAEKTLTSADSALNKILLLTSGWQQEDSKRVQGLLTQAEKMFSDVELVMGQVDLMLDTLMSNQTLAGQVMSDPTFRKRIDSTLYKLDKTLEQIYEKRVIVGLRRKKSE
ncbi:MAG: MlaD family protein [Bacteroidia bacterium]|nr:MlaD family protein [Bacteroidia bacterium]